MHMSCSLLRAQSWVIAHVLIFCVEDEECVIELKEKWKFCIQSVFLWRDSEERVYVSVVCCFGVFLGFFFFFWMSDM